MAREAPYSVHLTYQARGRTLPPPTDTLSQRKTLRHPDSLQNPPLHIPPARRSTATRLRRRTGSASGCGRPGCGSLTPRTTTGARTDTPLHCSHTAHRRRRSKPPPSSRSCIPLLSRPGRMKRERRPPPDAPPPPRSAAGGSSPSLTRGRASLRSPWGTAARSGGRRAAPERAPSLRRRNACRRVDVDASGPTHSVRRARPQAIRRHFAEDLLRRRTVRNLLAAARALNRTAVLPRALCYCDKMWNNLQACRAAGAWAMPLPFECPMDHLYLVPARGHGGHRPPDTSACPPALPLLNGPHTGLLLRVAHALTGSGRWVAPLCLFVPRRSGSGRASRSEKPGSCGARSCRRGCGTGCGGCSWSGGTGSTRATTSRTVRGPPRAARAPWREARGRAAPPTPTPTTRPMCAQPLHRGRGGSGGIRPGYHGRPDRCGAPPRPRAAGGCARDRALPGGAPAVRPVRGAAPGPLRVGARRGKVPAAAPENPRAQALARAARALSHPNHSYQAPPRSLCVHGREREPWATTETLLVADAFCCVPRRYCLTEPWEEMGRPGLVLGHEWERDVVKRHCQSTEVDLIGSG